MNPGRVIHRDEILLLKLGVRLQQLLLLHPYAVQWQEPFDPSHYGLLIQSIWKLISGIGEFSNSSKEGLRKECGKLELYWQDAVDSNFSGRWVTGSYIDPQVRTVCSLIDLALPPPPLANWFRVGFIAPVGRRDPSTQKWQPKDDESFRLHIAATGLTPDELFVVPPLGHNDPEYPLEFHGWRQLEAGIVKLEARVIDTDTCSSNESVPVAYTVAVQTGEERRPPRRKRSTQPGEAYSKLIAALTAHHQYENGNCTNFEPIGVNVLARRAKVSTSTSSKFFKDKFEGISNYQAGCRNRVNLNKSLEILNGEVLPKILFRSLPVEPADSDVDE